MTVAIMLDYKPGDAVVIGDCIRGYVETASVGPGMHVRYNVSWWTNGDLKDGWFEPEQMRPA